MNRAGVQSPSPRQLGRRQNVYANNRTVKGALQRAHGPVSSLEGGGGMQASIPSNIPSWTRRADRIFKDFQRIPGKMRKGGNVQGGGIQGQETVHLG